MIELLEEILRTKTVTTPDGKALKVHSSVNKELGICLQEAITEIQAQETLEVGLAYGLSALFICEALRAVGGRRHVAMDPFQTSEWDGIGKYNVRRAGFDGLVELHERPSYIVLPELLQQGRTIDFAFIDGFTTFDYKLVDAFLVDKLLRVGGLMAIRTGEMASGNKVCSFIESNLPYKIFKTFITYPDTAWADRCVVYQKSGQDMRPWTFHVDF